LGGIIPEMARKGKFITFEGGEGCGKSTQVERLAERLLKQGHAVRTTCEPGGTDVGDQIRHIVKFSYKAKPLVAETELLLFCASRAQLVREMIVPALRRGEIVVSDRFHDSTTVYQGFARQLDQRVVAAINEFAVNSCVPDLTIVIDIDPVIGLKRARTRAAEQAFLNRPSQNGELFDRMENADWEFFRRVQKGYLDLAKQEPHRVKVVDGNQSMEAIEEQVWNLVQRVL